MADNTLEVRFQLRYDSYSNWMGSSTILLPGEVAIAAFPTSNSIIRTDITPENTPPAVGIKVGDGIHHFDELPWLQGIAADVYNWAKQATKPIYTANEINGLAEYIASHTSGGGGSGGGSGTSSGYRIIYDNASSKYILQYYDDTDSEWKSASGDEINLSDILNRINTIERWANGAKLQLGNIELPLTALIYDEVLGYLNKLDVNDNPVAHQFVTSVVQTDGRISVTRSIISASDITSGVFGTSQGGTGLSRVEADELLIGSNEGNITTRTFVTTIDASDRASFATAGAIIDYVTAMTAGLTGAMHFVGEASVAIDVKVNNHVDPQIVGYNFRNAQPGDVILANNSQEYVWTGTEWRLLGDEGSYAIKGSIVNADIADNANISQDKIDGLSDSLAEKVDKVDGKGLSTYDFNSDYKDKLDGIEDNAQVNTIEHVFVNDNEVAPATVNGLDKSINLQIPILSAEDLAKIESMEANAQQNVIEHIFVNDTEIYPSTINGNTKSVGINFIPYTQEEQEKLHDIEAEAQVNKVETITINGTDYTPDANKNISITIDQAALDLDVLTGARVPGTTAGTYDDVDVTAVTKQLELARVAKTGLIGDLVQDSDTYITLYCGTSTDVI